MSNDLTALERYIRYQLSQLSARNGEHEFEHLAFDLARLRVASNLLPATGPVQAGGDQGRDFESYRTYLGKSPLANTSFTTLIRDEIVVGACTLQKERTPNKIKSDLRTIFANGQRPSHVAYFCEPDMTVAARHRLKDFCRDTYQATLDIFDGQAIAKMLADRDANWIADKYLTIPSDLWPPTSLDESYVSTRETWLVKKENPANFADFLEIKRGIHTAIREEDAKRDLAGWIDVMRSFTTEEFTVRLQQKARFEIADAEVRGNGSIEPAIPLVEEFLTIISSDRPATELFDAAVLVLYAWHAVDRLISLGPEQLIKWIERNDEIVESALGCSANDLDRCLLLWAKAFTAFLPRKSGFRYEDAVNRFLDRWKAVFDLVQRTPFFPVSPLKAAFDAGVSNIGHDPRLRLLIDQLDALIDERAGKAVVAERVKDRALNHLAAKRYIPAIDELFRMKDEWKSGEDSKKSIAAILTISQSFKNLGLHIAARYYAASALYSLLTVENDKNSEYISKSLLSISNSFFRSGEGITYIYSLGRALKAHHGVTKDPHDLLQHPHVQHSLRQALALRWIARRIAPGVVTLIDDALSTWSFSEASLAAFRASSEGEPWGKQSPQEIEAQIAATLRTHPFADLGSEKSISWSAFGTLWVIRCASDEEAWLSALELSAALQITHVEFADADLLIVPERVTIEIGLGDDIKPLCVSPPVGSGKAWQVTIPTEVPKTPEYHDQLMSMIMVILGESTTLPVPEFNKLIKERADRGFPYRPFFFLPLRDLMRSAQPDNLPIEKLTSTTRPIIQTPFQPLEPDELKRRA